MHGHLAYRRPTPSGSTLDLEIELAAPGSQRKSSLRVLRTEWLAAKRSPLGERATAEMAAPHDSGPLHAETLASSRAVRLRCMCLLVCLFFSFLFCLWEGGGCGNENIQEGLGRSQPGLRSASVTKARTPSDTAKRPWLQLMEDGASHGLGLKRENRGVPSLGTSPLLRSFVLETPV